MAFEISNRIWIQNATHTHTQIKKRKGKFFLTLKMAKTRTLLLAYFIFSSESQREREEEKAGKRRMRQNCAQLKLKITSWQATTTSTTTRTSTRWFRITKNGIWNFAAVFGNRFSSDDHDAVLLPLSTSLLLSLLSLPGWITANWFMLTHWVIVLAVAEKRLKTQQIIQISLLIFPPYPFPWLFRPAFNAFSPYMVKRSFKCETWRQSSTKTSTTTNLAHYNKSILEE